MTFHRAGKCVLIVGASPCGHLSPRAAWPTVKIHDAGPLPGGTMRFCVPAQGLPREALTHSVKQIEAMGVTIMLNRKVEDLLADKEARGFETVSTTLGAHISR